jgi:hypothetical protein
MSMNQDMYTTLREERRKALLAEAERERLATRLPGPRRALGRRAIGRLGSMMIAAGSRLERVEQRGRSVVYDL